MSQEKNWVPRPKTGASDTEYNNETWRPENAGDTIEGVFVRTEQTVGKYNKNVYDVQTDDGQIYTVWGTKVLDGQMAGVAISSHVKIEYLGKKPGKSNSYHDFNVFVAGEQAPAPVADVAASDPALSPVAAQAEGPDPAPVAAQVEAAPATSAPAPVVEESDDLPF